ncbi:MAG: long-chain fatty acid--CoA ligase [Bacteroidales bacterium]|nr:long-chain fatty acid--CoA ligase [Bacteroidales bacterium]
MEKITRLFDILDYRKEKYPNNPPVFTAKQDGKWVEHYLDEYIENANNVSYGLLQLGIQPGDKVALISTSRPEWNYLDMGIQQIGAVLVPIYPTISEDDYRYILSHAEVKLIFLEGPELLRKISNILPELTHVQKIFTFKKQNESTSNFQELVDLGKANPAPEKVQAIKDSIKTNDLVTIIYTSGTTGFPKGVMLSHQNIITNIYGTCYILDERYTRSLSFLPLCHIYERMMNYLYQYQGMNTYYAENIGKVVDNLKDARPHIVTAVPRVLEKIYDKIYRKGETLKGIKKKLFYWTLDFGTEYDITDNSWFYNLKRKIADRITYHAIRDIFGGECMKVVSGGAAIQPRLARFFTCVGLRLHEGYGLTETAPVIAVTTNDIKGIKFGTAGPPLRGIEVKIDPETKEIICRGKSVMLGYYKSPELTAEVIDEEGWFHTGDTGIIEPEGQVRITGRLKSLFKTSMGKFVNPEVIEEKFKESPFVLDMMVVGEGQKFAAALIAPDFEFLRDWQKRHGINCSTPQEMIEDKQTLERYKKVMDKYNKLFGETEQVKRFKLVADTWSEANGMLTPTLKIKRRKVSARYHDEIEELFK